MKKQTKNTYAPLEKVLALSGLTLVVVGCIASIYGAYVNQRFIHDPLDFIYYVRYLILLGGGFTIGYLLTKKASGHKELFGGVLYAVLAMALYWLFDLVRFILQELFGSPSFPLGKVLFLGIPLLAIATVTLIGYTTRLSSRFVTVAQKVFVLSFIAYQLYFIVTSIPSFGQSQSLWLTVGNTLITPLFITIACYLLLSGIKRSFDRLFYAALIGAVYAFLGMVLWEFRTDPSLEATNAFNGAVTLVTLVFAGIVLLQARRAIR